MPIPYEVEKPIWEGDGIIDIGIRESILQDAIRRHDTIEVRYKGNRAFIDPKEWMKNGKLMLKVFRFPDNPMRLWEGRIIFDIRTEEAKWKELSKST